MVLDDSQRHVVGILAMCLMVAVPFAYLFFASPWRHRIPTTEKSGKTKRKSVRRRRPGSDRYFNATLGISEEGECT